MGSMNPRLDPFAAAPALMKSWLEFGQGIRHRGLEKPLMELVKIRASQLNGCAFCLHMHTAHARAAGETEERLYVLSAWREAPLFTARERAALAWTEALTRVADGSTPDAVYEELAEHFTERERVQLTLAIVAINGWNRIVSAFKLFEPTRLARGAG